MSVRAIAAAAATGVQVGAAMVATRVVIAETTPASLALMRYALGVLTLAPALLLAPRVRIGLRDGMAIALLGIGQFGLLIALLNHGLQTVPAARAAVIFATFPLLTLLCAAMLGHERLTLAKTAGVMLTIVGVAVALADKSAPIGGAEPWTGEAAVAASALTGAVCSVLYRPYLARYPALPVGVLAMLGSVGFLAVWSALEGFFAGPPRISSAGWSAIVFIGVTSGIGYFLWLYALRHAAATRVTVFLSLSPVTAAILGVPWLGEAVTLPLLAGVGLVAAGLALATLAPEPPPTASVAARRRGAPDFDEPA